MKIVLFHYHLKKGGVTSVIKEQVAALKNDNDVLVITGETPEDFIHDRVVIIPELGYTRISENKESPEKIAALLTNTIERHFGSQCNVMHCHNPILAKNRYLLDVIRIIAASRMNIFLQIHDFAEDGRPMSYTRAEYPENVHYGVINNRDYNFLIHSGIREEGLHYLPNPVHPLPGVDVSTHGKSLILYPVRAIRRKNIGEILLLSLFLKNGDCIGVTLPALNPRDIRSYQEWKLFAALHSLKVEFDLGLKYDFTDLLAKSKYFITTSITEGFGYIFLLPWIYRRFLLGRIIPDTCSDFIKNGIDLSGLYENLLIPAGLIDKMNYLDRIEAELNDISHYYGFEIDNEKFLAYFKTVVAGDFIDFGLLSEEMQASVIVKVMENKDIKDRLLRVNPKLAMLSSGSFNRCIVDKNEAVIRRLYSREKYTELLTTVYRKIMATSVIHRIDKQKLLSCFLKPDRFTMLKWSSYNGR